MSEAGKRTGGEWGLSGGGHCISAYLPGTSETDRASSQHYYVPLLKTEYAPWQKSSDWLISEEDYKATAAFVIEAVNSYASLKARVEELEAALRRCASRMRGHPMWDDEFAGPCRTLQIVEAALQSSTSGEG